MGTFNPVSGLATTCTLTPAGTFTSNVGSIEANLCPISTYSAVLGATSPEQCTTCPEGRITPFAGAPDVTYCFNPAFNFAMAAVCLFISFMAIKNFLLFGGIHKVAYFRVRRVSERVARIFMKSYGFLHIIIEENYQKFLHKKNLSLENRDEESDDIVRKLHGRFSIGSKDVDGGRNNRANDESEISNTNQSVALSFFKIFIFFTLGTVFMATSLFQIVLSRLIHVFFHGVILFRSMPDLQVAEQIMALIEKYLLTIFYFVPYIDVIIRPLLYAFQFILNFKINLAVVGVTCEGSLAPVQLFFNILILLFAAIIVQTDYCVLLTPIMTGSYERYVYALNQSTTFMGKLKQLRKLLICYFFISLGMTRNFITIVQYTATLITFQQFYAQSYWRHASTEACDNVPAVKYFDTFMAVISSIMFHLLVPLVIALTSQVLYPKRVKGILEDEEGNWDFSGKVEDYVKNVRTSVPYVTKGNSFNHVTLDDINMRVRSICILWFRIIMSI